MYAEHATSLSRSQNLYFSRRYLTDHMQRIHQIQAPSINSGWPSPIVRRAVRRPSAVRTEFGGAERDRTADPLLAKQVLSQLSYSPNHRNT